MKKKFFTYLLGLVTLSSFSQGLNFRNPGAETPVIGQSFIQYTFDTIPSIFTFGWKTTTSIEVQTSGQINGNESHSGNQHFELLSRELGDNMYQKVFTIPNSTVKISFYHKKRRAAGRDRMEVLAGPDIDNLEVIGTFEVLLEEGWKYTTVNYEVPNNQWYTTFMLKGIEGTTKSVGNLIDDISIERNTLSTPEKTIELRNLATNNLGDTYTIYLLTGQQVRTGIIGQDIYNILPKQTPFLLYIEGYKPTKYLLDR